MPNLIQGSPFLDAFNKGQTRRTSSAAASAGLRRDEQAMEDAEVTRITADKYDQAIADLMRKREGGLRAQVPAAPSPTVSQSPQVVPAVGAQQPVTGASGIKVGAPARAPASGAVTPSGGIRMMPSRGVLAEAALATKGMRAEGVGMSADIEAEQAKAESEQFDKMFEIAEKYPQMAVEFARKMGLTEQMPLLERMLQDQEITMAINAKRDELSKLYKDHPDLYGKAMEQEVKNIMNHFGSVRQGAGQPGQTTEVQPASTGGGLATAVPTVPAGVSDYSTPLPAIPPTGSGTVHKNIGYMDFLVEKGIAKDHGQAFQLINQAKGDQVARARLVATIFNGMKEDLLDDRDENAKFAAAQAFMEKLLQASGGTSAAPEEDKFSIFPRDPSQRVVDKIYKTPNGNLIRWLGEGWESIGSQGGLRSAQPRPVPLAKAPEHEPGEQALKPAALPPRTPEPLKAPSQPLPKVQAPWARKAEKDVTEAGKRYIARRTQQDEEKKRRDIEVTAADARALIEDGIERERAIGEALRHANSIGRDVTRIDIEPALGAR